MESKAINECFDKETLPSDLLWHEEPTQWIIDKDKNVLQVYSDANTDFWQRTHYGFQRDSGHFLYLKADQSFTLTTKVTSYARHQYDQAGLMVRLSSSCWLKASVEYELEADSRLGVVVTNRQYSDWSTQDISSAIKTVWIKVKVTGTDCIVESSFDGIKWQQIRVAHLSSKDPNDSMLCGLYACSPKESGYRADFHFLTYEPNL